MNSRLHTLTYFSRNCLAHDSDMASEIENILQVARPKNRALGITGALLCSDGSFAQVLEGPLSAIEAVFDRIVIDPRHREVHVLNFRALEQRSFARWSMGYAGALDPISLAGSIDAMLDTQEGQGDAGKALIYVLKELITRFEGNRGRYRRAGHASVQT